MRQCLFLPYDFRHGVRRLVKCHCDTISNSHFSFEKWMILHLKMEKWMMKEKWTMSWAGNIVEEPIMPESKEVFFLNRWGYVEGTPEPTEEAVSDQSFLCYKVIFILILCFIPTTNWWENQLNICPFWRLSVWSVASDSLPPHGL